MPGQTHPDTRFPASGQTNSGFSIYNWEAQHQETRQEKAKGMTPPEPGKK
jgi:hypothetical protein